MRQMPMRLIRHAPRADKLLLLPKQKPKLLPKLLLPQQKARLLSVLLACRKRAAALGALAPCSALDLLCNPSQCNRCHRCQKQGQKEGERIVPHLLPGTEPREVG